MSSIVAESSSAPTAAPHNMRSTVAPAANDYSSGSVRAVRRKRPLKLRVHTLLRWLHIYLSLVSLVVVLFFAATGLTLNHPDWLAVEHTQELTGTLPASWKAANGIDWMVVSEALRTTQGVHGTVADRTEDDRQAALTFRAPGYAAATFIDVATGKYKLTVSSQGVVGMLNDLHRGRDAGSAWAWVIDIVAGLLVVLSLAGLGLLFYLKKVRVRALITMAVGALVVFALAKLAT